MRRFAFALALVALIAGARTARPAEPKTGVPLWKAYRDGKVAVKGHSTGGYSRAEISVTNKTTEKLSVDVNCSYLNPTGGTVQRLGFGLIKPGDPETTVDVEANATLTFEVLTVCMDVSRHSPDEKSAFVLAKETAPAVPAKALKAWKEHPEVSQNDVQSLAWGLQPSPPPEKRAAARVVACDLPENTRKVGVVNGTVFALVGPGALYAGVQGQELLPVGHDAEDLLVQADGLHVLFRSPPAAVTSATCERRACVARWDGEDRFTEEVTVAKLGRLEAAGQGFALVAEAKELALVRGQPGAPSATREVVGAASDTVLRGGTRTLVVAQRDGATTLTELTPSTRGVATRSFATRMPLSQLALGPEGDLYGLSARGVLFAVEADGELRRLQNLIEDGTGVKTGEPETHVRFILRVEGGVLVATTKDNVRVVKGEIDGGFTLPEEGTELLIASDGRAYARKGARLAAYAGGAWSAVRFVTPVAKG